MRNMFGLVLVAGIALAGSAVYLAKGYIGQTQTQLEQERELRAKVGPVVQVYVAKNPKDYGEQLTKDDVQLVYWPKNSLPEGVFMTEDEMFSKGIGISRSVLRPIEKFEPIMQIKVTEPGEPAGLTGQLARGMRAFAIKIDEKTGVQTNVRPGDHVDIYWTGAVDGSGSELTRRIETST
ncbi:MAG: Flp pilus assembly protein CpaB, partial [Rhodobacteraceae bacterium]|nr:Flp pilus assembly protein CpaB [Paracoccaceae bacterium]